jgi:hypothetical protein
VFVKILVGSKTNNAQEAYAQFTDRILSMFGLG